MKHRLGDNNYRLNTFVFKDEESYYDFKEGNIRMPSDYAYENLSGEVHTYKIEDLKLNK